MACILVSRVDDMALADRMRAGETKRSDPG